MQGYVDFLRQQNTDEEELSDDYLLKSAIERNLQLAIESALDIGEVINIFGRSGKTRKTIAV